MSEVAIILSDLYLAENGRGGVDDRDAAVPKDVLPALTRIARYAGVSPLPGGWRAWLAGWLGRGDLTSRCADTPAVIAAAALTPASSLPAHTGSVWLATPLHLVAGLSSVHLDYRGLLKLDAATLHSLCRDFNHDFAVRGFSLQQLESGALIACGPRFAQLPRTCDPARLLGGGIAGSTVQGAGASQLLMLGAELEMWLHAHPLNAARARRREAPLTTLWLWGGGEPMAATRGAPPLPPAHPEATFMTVFGADPVIEGLCVVSGARLRAPAASAHDILNCGAARTAVIIELFRTDKAQPATLMDLLEHLDERVLAPVVRALKDGVIRQLTLIANDRCSVLSARDGLRFWRRSRGPWAVLQ
ncbi:MAG TPA: hypothetical protein VHW25_18935 [Steroidobacteraceae bacterium]|jgi:hypothetical protein|nr:hypothetical protein [Steroidobacteraceae bacterium]